MTDRRVLYVMQGVPGSGKSVIAKMIEAVENTGSEKRRAVVLSTDDHRLQPQPWCEDGHGHTGGELICPQCGTAEHVVLTDTYVFDPADNERYHRATQQECARLMGAGQPVIIVDNTNIQFWQAQPYLVLAQIHGYLIQVVSVDCGLPLAQARQEERREDRRVPSEVIAGMYGKMERLLA